MRALLLVTFALTAGALAQGNIHLKDGRVLAAKQLRRDKDTIIATLEIPAKDPGGNPTTGDFGFALKDIFRLEFGKPSVLDVAPNLIADGKADEALAQLDPVVKYYGGFRDAPGSWWVDAVPLQIQALLALKRDKEAGEVADQFGRLATDPEVRKFSKAFTAVARTRKGEHLGSLSLYDEASQATKRPDILGLIAVNKGESLLALGEELRAKGEAEAAAVRYEEALLSFLRIPALYPGQRMYLPQAIFGAAQAYVGTDDFDRARTSIKELKEAFAATPEAKATDALSEKLEKRAALLATPEPKK
jgi:tetratricopeptide (TPR) repeat protein